MTPVEAPIFIAGIGRSGTTILHRILSEHPNLAWLSRLSNRYPNLPARGRTLMKALDYPVLGRYLKKRFSPGECYDFWDYYCRGFSLTCRDLYRQDVTVRSRTQIRRVVSKILTPKRHRFLAKITGWPRLGYLHEIFGDAKFIHIHRDGRAVANSRIQERWWRGWQGPHNWNRPPLTADEEEEWKKHDRSYVALASLEWRGLMDAFEVARSAAPSAPCLQISYEDFCSDPLTVLRQVIDFCELPWTSSFETAVGSYQVTSANNKWQEFLTEEQQRIMESVLQDHLKKYGYT